MTRTNESWFASLSAEEKEEWRRKVHEGMAQSEHRPGPSRRPPRKKPIVRFRGLIIP